MEIEASFSLAKHWKMLFYTYDQLLGGDNVRRLVNGDICSGMLLLPSVGWCQNSLPQQLAGNKSWPLCFPNHVENNVHLTIHLMKTPEYLIKIQSQFNGPGINLYGRRYFICYNFVFGGEGKPSRKTPNFDVPAQLVVGTTMLGVNSIITIQFK